MALSTSSISSPGIGSGLDVNNIVSQLMTTEQGPMNQLKQNVTDAQTKISAYGQISSAVSSFQTAISALASASKFNAQTATSNDTTTFTANSNGTATSGNHSITVTSLAQNQKLALGGFSSTASNIGSGTLTIAFGTYDATGNTFTASTTTTPVAISIPSGSSSLGSIRDAINAANAGVTASIVNDGSTNGNRLVITSNLTGTANSMKISVADDDGNNTDSSGLSQLAYDPTQSSGSGKNLTQLQAPTNAVLNVDGITVTKSTNTINDALQGVTLNLLKTNIGSTANLTVATDTTTITASANAFVTAYNSLNTTIRSLSTYVSGATTQAALVGDSTTRTIATQVKNLITGQVTGNGSLTSLSQIGIAFQQDGSLALDSTKLQTALTNNFSSVAGLFSTRGSTTDAQISFLSGSSNTKMGTYAVSVSQIATQGSLTASSAPNLTITAGANDAVNLTINGTAYNLTLSPGTYASTNALASEIQARLAGAGSSATVGATGGNLTITSNAYGSRSTVAVSGGNGASSVFGSSPSSTTGVNTAGTINGVAATGSGQNLFGAVGDASEGISINVGGTTLGARGTVSYTSGIAYQLNNYATSLLNSTGILTTTTNNLNTRVSTLTDEETTEQTRLDALQQSYLNQYTALDTLISSLQSTQTYLTQQLAAISANNKA